MEIYPGTVHLKGLLSLEEQKAVVVRCQEVGGNPAGFYIPVVRGGASMRIQMTCLGRHWNAKTYKYEPTRSDYDGLSVQQIPNDFVQLAMHAAAKAGVAIEPDICILNFYGEASRLGLHQDKDERPETIGAGIPVVSISLGDSAKFLIGGTKRNDAVRVIIVESGDAVIMGGPSRLRYHGVSGILPGSAPGELAISGRYNLNFRQY